MPFRQAYQLTSAKLMSDTQSHICKVNDFYWISNNYPSFFLFLLQKTPKIASSLPPFLLASSLACLLPSPVPGSFLPGSS